MNLPRNQTALLFAVLTALGLAGNYFSFTLFFSIDFVFGSVFSMLALQLLGARLGVASALLASSAMRFDLALERLRRMATAYAWEKTA